MTRSPRHLFAPFGCSMLLSGLAAWAPAPAQAYWHGYRCWGGCWARPVVIDPTVVAPVVVAPPVQVTPEVESPSNAQLCSRGGNVALRTGPNQNFVLVASLSPGIPLVVQRNQVNELGQDWSLVNAGGYEGFIPSGHVCYGN
ncbi:MAG: SH3 domain-containing protein [Vulcanococcus sp.]|jgi:hypothetical protein